MGIAIGGLGIWMAMAAGGADAGAGAAAGASPAPVAGPDHGAAGKAKTARPLLPSFGSAPVTSDRAPAPDEYRLERAKDRSGGWIYEAPGFVAHVAHDGSVRFNDRHFAGITFLPSLPLLIGPPPPAGVPTLQTALLGLARRRPRPIVPRRAIPSLTRPATPAPPSRASVPIRARCAGIPSHAPASSRRW